MSNSSERPKPLGFDLRTRIAAVQHIHEWHSDGTGEGQCDCDGRWFKNKRLYDLHLAAAVIRELNLDISHYYKTSQGREVCVEGFWTEEGTDGTA